MNRREINQKREHYEAMTYLHSVFVRVAEIDRL
jgi:hypothetical protein